VGEAKAKKSATAKFIAMHPRCALCGGADSSQTREHMPPKALFDGSLRPDKLVMPACDACNRGTSKADLVASIVSRWNYDSPAQERRDHSKLAAQARRQIPELLSEWTRHDDASSRPRAIAHLKNHGVQVPSDAGIASIGPLTIRQLSIFAHKLVLCLYFETFKEPLPNAGRLCAYWRSKEDFARDGIPQPVLDMLPKYQTLMQGVWNAAETFEYRYDFNAADGLFGCFARLRTSLYVTGFALRDNTMLTEELGSDWIKPSELLSDIPHFAKKL
jgi:hypothetical protein